MKNLRPINKRLLVAEPQLPSLANDSAFLVPDGFNKEPKIYTTYLVLRSALGNADEYPEGTHVVAMSHLAEKVEIGDETFTFIPESSIVCSFE